MGPMYQPLMIDHHRAIVNGQHTGEKKERLGEKRK
jgi:hypothetical protein